MGEKTSVTFLKGTRKHAEYLKECVVALTVMIVCNVVLEGSNETSHVHNSENVTSLTTHFYLLHGYLRYCSKYRAQSHLQCVLRAFISWKYLF